VYHLWHPTRAAARWADSPGIARFRRDLPARCRFGLDRPYEQPVPVATHFHAPATHCTDRPEEQGR
jgi:hypothetical protein